MQNSLGKVRIFANLAIIFVITILSLIKIFIVEQKDIDKQQELDKENYQHHIEYLYKKNISNISKVLDSKIKFLAKTINSTSSNKKNMLVSKQYSMLKQSLPSLSHIIIYDKDFNPLYLRKHNNTKNQETAHRLKQIINQHKNQNQKNEIFNVIEESNEGKVFLVYIMRMREKDGNIETIEIATDITYLREELMEGYFHFNEYFTFELLLWENKADNENFLIQNVQVLNYKSLKPFNYKRLVPLLMALIFMLILINSFYMYFMREFNEAKKRVRDILDSQSSLMVIFTKNEIISCNKSFMEALGFENEEELKLNYKQVSDFFIHEDEFETFMTKNMFWSDYIIENQKNNFYDIFLKDRYGDKVDIFDVSANFYIKDGANQYYIASFVNSRVRYERKQDFNLEKKINQTITDNSNDGFISWNTKTDKIHVSKRLNQILGYKSKEITNSIDAWLSLINPEHKKQFLQNIEDCSQAKDNLSQSEILIKHKNEKWVWVFSRIKMFIGEDDKVKRFILFFTDIDDKKRQETIMKEKISKGIEELKDKQELLSHQSKLASMGEMIGSIAHQWRQPLNELGIKIQSLKFQHKKGLIDDEFISNFVAQNKATIMFMSNTIDDFRSFYKTDKIKSDFSILKSINFCFNIQSAELKNENIEIVISGDDFMHNGFQSEFKQVILNLVNNAKDAFSENNTENKKINILIENKKVIFTDSAGGIPKDIISRIFEPYFTTKEQGKGTGIGLHMSKSIIENNSGLLSVKNVDDGACFTIDFSG